MANENFRQDEVIRGKVAGDIVAEHCSSVVENKALVCMQTMSVTEVLALDLEIPQYQRAYIWRRSTVESFVTDIQKWTLRNKNEEGRRNHLGCIILRAVKSSSNKIVYEIVDGQQRLVTLALWARLLGLSNEKNLLISKPVRGGVDAIKRARDVCNKFSIEIREFDRMEVSVLEISENARDELAYAFFDNTNTLGKKLSDYDLLKTHHLRYLRDDIDGGRASRFCAHRWNLLSSQNVGDDTLQKYLLNDCLYRIRQWTRIGGHASFPMNADNYYRTLYNHFISRVDDSIGSLFESKAPQEVERVIIGGMPFFEYVEYFRSRLVQFVNIPSVLCLRKYLAGHSKGVVYKAVIATAFVAYCRFGDWYLSDVICALAKVISYVRCRDCVQERMLTWCSDGKNIIKGGWGGYMSRVTEAVLHSPSDVALVAILQGEEFQYDNQKDSSQNTKLLYWNALDEFLKECPDKRG